MQSLEQLEICALRIKNEISKESNLSIRGSFDKLWITEGEMPLLSISFSERTEHSVWIGYDKSQNKFTKRLLVDNDDALEIVECLSNYLVRARNEQKEM